MIELKQTETFRRWLIQLRDTRAQVLIAARLERLSFGHVGNVKPVGEGVSELRIDFGPGYRIYYQKHGETFILLLCGGDKSTQAKDIKTAKLLAKKWSKDYA